MNTKLLLKKLVGINSVFPQELKISLFLQNYLKKLNFDVSTVTTSSRRKNIVATFGSSSRYLGLYGHMDSVPPDPHYTFDPFIMKEKKGKAFGLGVADMKGGITAILKTAEFASKNKLPLKVVFGVDEENISQGAHDLVNSGLLNDINFMFVAESGQIKNNRQNFSVCYGRMGRILYDLTIKGIKSHAAEQEKGKNAIVETVKLIDKINKINWPSDVHFGETRIIFHTIQSQTNSFSVPDICKIQFSTLTNAQTTSKNVISRIMNIAKNNGLSVQISPHKRSTPYAESYKVNNKDSFLKKIETSVFKRYNVAPVYTESVADENVFSNRLKIPVVTLGPIGGGDHTSKEWVNLDSLKKVIEAYKQILLLYHKQNIE